MILGPAPPPIPGGARARVARNAVLKVLVQATRLLSLLFLVYAARVLGPEGFGQFTFAYTLATMLGAALDLGMHAIVVREVARAPEAAPRYVAAAVTLKAWVLVPAGLVLGLAPILTARPGATTAAVWLLGLALAAQSFIELAVSVFTGFERVGVELRIRLVEKLVLVGVGLAGLALGGGLGAVAGAFAVAALVSLALSLSLLHRRFAPVARPWAPAEARRLVRLLSPVAGAFVLSFAASRLVPLLVALLAGDAAAGYLGAASRVLEVALVVPGALAAAAFPALARASRQGLGLRRAVAQMVQVLLLLGLPVALLFGVGAGWLTRLVFGPAYDPAAALLRILAGAAVLGFVNVIVTPVVLALDRPGLLLRLAAAVCAGSAIVGPLLVLAWGASGGALTLVLIEAAVLTGTVIALRREVGLPIGMRGARSLGAAAGALVVGTAAPAGAGRLGLTLGAYGLGVLVLRPWPPLAWRALLRGALGGTGRGSSVESR